MRIIPAIDLINGKCVRLTKGDYATEKIYNEDPVEVAKSFEAIGVQYLHLVDLDGAKAGGPKNLSVLEQIAKATRLTIDYGGGLREANHVNNAFNAGASQVNLGSVAVKNPKLVAQWIQDFGREKIILSADVKGQIVSVGGWLEDNGPHIHDFMSSWEQYDAEYVCSTAISQDGTLQGPDMALYTDLLEQFPSMKLIASGGVGHASHVLNLLDLGVDGCIIGKAIYEEKISFKELENLVEQCSKSV